MIFFIGTNGAGKGQKDLKYHCNICYTWLTNSSLLQGIMGRPALKTYVNPHGIQCDLLTFSDCQEFQEAPDATTEYTWFDGYQWRIIVCAGCGFHLGWKFEAVREALSPKEFFGILEDRLTTEIPDGEKN